jgi:hypothetical protein
MVAHKKLYHRFLDLAKVFYRFIRFFSLSILRKAAWFVKPVDANLRRISVCFGQSSLGAMRSVV